MKNPGFLINGSVIVLKSIEKENQNIIAVVVGRYEKIENNTPKYLALPIVLDSDEEAMISSITQNETMASYIVFTEDEVLSTVDINIKNIDNAEWVIIKTIEFLMNNSIDKSSDKIKVKKLENTLSDAFDEKNFTKFKWIISNIKLTDYDINQWYKNIINNREYYLEYFGIKDKDIDTCISKLEDLLRKI